MDHTRQREEDITGSHHLGVKDETGWENTSASSDAQCGWANPHSIDQMRGGKNAVLNSYGSRHDKVRKCTSEDLKAASTTRPARTTHQSMSLSHKCGHFQPGTPPPSHEMC
jgi:hypothetical protein